VTDVTQQRQMLARMRANGNFSDASHKTLQLAFSHYKLHDEPEWRCWAGVAPGVCVCVFL